MGALGGAIEVHTYRLYYSENVLIPGSYPSEVFVFAIMVMMSCQPPYQLMSGRPQISVCMQTAYSGASSHNACGSLQVSYWASSRHFSRHQPQAIALAAVQDSLEFSAGTKSRSKQRQIWLFCQRNIDAGPEHRSVLHEQRPS